MRSSTQFSQQEKLAHALTDLAISRPSSCYSTQRAEERRVQSMLRRRDIAKRQNPVPFVIGGWPEVVKPSDGIKAEMYQQSLSSSSMGLGLPEEVVSDIYNREVCSLCDCCSIGLSRWK